MRISKAIFFLLTLILSNSCSKDSNKANDSSGSQGDLVGKWILTNQHIIIYADDNSIDREYNHPDQGNEYFEFFSDGQMTAAFDKDDVEYLKYTYDKPNNLIVLRAGTDTVQYHITKFNSSQLELSNFSHNSLWEGSLRK